MQKKGRTPLLYILKFTIASMIFSCNSYDKNMITDDGPDSVSVSNELKKLFDIGDLSKYDDTARSYQTSSYDTTGGNDDGFSGRYSFLRRNEDSTLVIFEAYGAGVIHRFWTPTPSNDTLDFYIDDPDKVSFSIRFLDLFSGEVYPFVDPLCGNQIGGYFCYFPIPFQSSCKIVCRGKKMQFYQIQYKLYADATKVKPYSPDLTNEEKAMLELVKNLWNKPQKDISNFYDIGEIQEESGSNDIKPGNNLTIFERRNGGRILGIELMPATIFEGLDKQIDIKITWDNETRPGIHLPVHDFFGYAFGKQSMQSILLGSLGEKNYCYFPMPFDERAKIELIYRKKDDNQEPVNISFKIFYAEQPRDKASEGKFYADWNKNVNPKKGEPHYFLERKGKGHYVGTILQTQGLRAGMTLFFEGDDITFVDGEQIMHGTGSEDYFNGGWYAFVDTWDTKLSLPIHGALDYSLPMCRTGGYRLFLTDKISFRKSITHTIEHGPVGNAFPVDYTSVALYYADSISDKIQQEPKNDLTEVYIPDTLMIYPQLMSYTVWDEINFESEWKYPTGGMSFKYTVTDESRLRISLKEIPFNSYNLFLDYTKFEEGCEFSVWQRQTRISPWIDSVSDSTVRKEALFMCPIDIRDFKDTMTFRFRTDGKQNKLFLNRLILVRM